MALGHREEKANADKLVRGIAADRCHENACAMSKDRVESGIRKPL